MIEHRYPEGNRLVLTLLGAVEDRGSVASVYEQSGQGQGYVVRGYAQTGVTASGGEAFYHPAHGRVLAAIGGVL